MATCDRGHTEITYDDVLGLVPCPLCETLKKLETAEDMLLDATLALECQAGPMTPKEPLPCKPM
jgi:hypothetical protein